MECGEFSLRPRFSRLTKSGCDHKCFTKKKTKFSITLHEMELMNPRSVNSEPEKNHDYHHRQPASVVYATNGSEKPTYELFYEEPEQDEVPPVEYEPIPINRVITDDASVTIPVRCGSASGKLHVSQFYCPGIHQPCVEFEGFLISPKEFTVRGSKEKQKDWKGSIRIGRSTLRIHMEAGTIDFFDHPIRCSGKCQSRNYVNVANPEELAVQRALRKRSATELQQELLYNIQMQDAAHEESQDKTTTDPTPHRGKRGRGRPPGSINKKKKSVLHIAMGGYETEDAEEQTSSPPGLFTDSKTIMSCLREDPICFWSQMANVGVINTFLDDIILSTLSIKKIAVEKGVNREIADLLTRTVLALGIQDSTIKRVQMIEMAAYQKRMNMGTEQDANLLVVEEKTDISTPVETPENSTDTKNVAIIAALRVPKDDPSSGDNLMDVPEFFLEPSSSQNQPAAEDTPVV